MTQILASAQKASALSRQLLAFSHKQVFTSVPLNLNTVIYDIEPKLRALAGEAVTLAVRLEPALHWVMADTAQLEQVLFNVIANARDAMPEGGVITIETRNSGSDDDVARAAEHAGRRLRHAQRARHRHRDAPGNPRSDVRAVLHARKRKDWARGSAWPRSTGSPVSSADSFMSRANPARARRFRSTCRRRRVQRGANREAGTDVSSHAAWARFCWSRKTRASVP